MKRRVRKELIRNWIKENSPGGMFRLGQESKVSAWTIAKIKAGYVPKKQITRELLANALGVSEEVLFPPASGKAS